MARPLRIEFPNAIYHVTSRGDRREPIYRDDADRGVQLEVLAQAMARFDAQVLAYCLMDNHYHLVLYTRQVNLSRLMRHVNGVFTQRFNRRHDLCGHLFQGRFKAILVDRDAYLLPLCRYVDRNPVAAGLVAAPQDWAWSSCRAHLGLEATPPWLDTDGLLSYLLGRPVANAGDRKRAALVYARMLQEGDESLWSEGLRQQVFLGDAAFVDRSLAAAGNATLANAEVPRAQRTRPRALADLLAASASREIALHEAYTRHGHTMTQLARELNLSVSRVSRLIASVEQAKNKT